MSASILVGLDDKLAVDMQVVVEYPTGGEGLRVTKPEVSLDPTDWITNWRREDCLVGEAFELYRVDWI